MSPITVSEGSAGSAGTMDALSEGQEIGELLEQRDSIRQKCLDRVESAQSTTILGSADLTAYREKVLSESALELSGYRSHREKLHALMGMLYDWIPEIIQDSHRLEREFERLLQEAEESGGISKRSIDDWRCRLTDQSVIYYKKKEFITKKFPAYVGNWKKLGADLQSIAEQQKKLGLEDDALPELKAIHAAGFMDSHYLFKRDRAHAALAALAAYEKGQYAPGRPDPGLFAEAKRKLETAASDGAISEWKVGKWLRKIFESKAPKEKIAAFVHGTGVTTLGKLITHWTAVRRRFDAVEEKRLTKGPPRGFHFVRLDVFLGWHFVRREAYVEEAERRFHEPDFLKERESFLRIRHALDTKDWEEAEAFIATAKREDLSGSERVRLASMELFLREHRGKRSPERAGKNPYALNAELQSLLEEVPAELQELYRECLRRDYNDFWVLCTLLYNRDWCHAHHYLTAEREIDLHEQSKELTALRIRDGHGGGHEANDLTGENNQRPAVRDQTQMNSAQILFTDRSSKDRVVNAIAEQGSSRQFWYWTSLIPEGMSIARHRQLTSPGGMNSRMKRLMRQLDASGYRFTRKGFPEPKNGSTYEKLQKPSMN